MHGLELTRFTTRCLIWGRRQIFPIVSGLPYLSRWASESQERISWSWRYSIRNRSARLGLPWPQEGYLWRAVALLPFGCSWVIGHQPSEFRQEEDLKFSLNEWRTLREGRCRWKVALAEHCASSMPSTPVFWFGCPLPDGAYVSKGSATPERGRYRRGLIDDRNQSAGFALPDCCLLI